MSHSGATSVQSKVKLYSLFWTNHELFKVQVVNFLSIFLNWSEFVSSLNLNHLKILLKSFNGKMFRSIWHHVPELRQFKSEQSILNQWDTYEVQVDNLQSIFLNWSDFVSSWNLNQLKILLKYFNGNFFRKLLLHVPELRQFKVRSKLYGLFKTNGVLFEVKVVNF